MSERDDQDGSETPGGADASMDTRTMYDPVPSGALASIPAEGWYVVLDDEQQGPMSRGTLLEKLNDRSDAADCWIWREGYADWVRGGDVDGLQELIAFNEASAAAVVEANPTGATPEGDSEDRTRVMTMGQQDAVHSEAADLREMDAVSAEESLDSLFGDESAEAAVDGGEFFDVPESASAEDAMLYQRQDTSVLFTLDDFDRKNEGQSAGSIGIGDGLGERTPESGLIDIRAIARNRVESDDGSARGERLFGESAEPQVATQWRRPVTTRLSVGQQPLLRTRGPSPFWKVMSMAMAFALLMVVALGGWFLLQDDSSEAPPVVVTPPTVEKSTPVKAVVEVAPPSEMLAESPSPEPTPEAESVLPGSPVEGSEGASAEAVSSPQPVVVEAVDAPPEIAPVNPPKAQAKKTPRTPEQIAAARAASERRAARKAEKQATRAAAREKSRQAKIQRDMERGTAKSLRAQQPRSPGASSGKKKSEATAILDTLGGSSKAGSPTSSPGAGSGSKSSKLSSSAIRRTIRKVHSRVVACHRDGGAAGSGVKIVKARLVVRGDGGVASASVGSPFRGTAVGACMVGVLKGVQFPSFGAESQVVSIPFRL